MGYVSTYKEAEVLLGDAAYRQRSRYYTKVINDHFRANDESRLFPIFNKFNVTERAIRKVSRNWCDGMNIEYFLAVDAAISDIVNNERNW